MRNKLYLWIGFFPLVISLIIALIIITTFRFLPSRLPLFYSAPWGEGQLANLQQFLVIPGSITIITLLNLSLSWQLHHQQSFFKKALLLSSVIVSLILTIAFVKIVLLFI